MTRSSKSFEKSTEDDDLFVFIFEEHLNKIYVETKFKSYTPARETYNLIDRLVRSVSRYFSLSSFNFASKID